MHLNGFDLGFRLSLYFSFLPPCLCLLFGDLLLLGGDLEFRHLRLNLLVVLHQVLGNYRFGHSNCDYLYTRSPMVAVLLQLYDQLLIQVVKLFDKHLVQR